MNPKLIKIVDEMKTPEGRKNFVNNIVVHINKLTCVDCGKETDPAKYKKQVDKDEFYISGLCRKCQKLYFPPELKE